MNLEQDLAGISEQEARLRFERFDAQTAWELGQKLKQAAEALHRAIAIDISFFGQTLFFYAMSGTSPDNAEWARRKRNVVQRFHRSSYAVGLMLKQKQNSLEERGLDARDYAAHGGSFPIFVQGVGCIGAITVSGLPQREDHELVVEVLADYLEVPYEELALDP
ncbi:heme-degrading domain-containing protein [Meiothermus sp. CFH 77666]|uniref:heme-degrading domain-containing protein n=1 Tax=Meiothermus sp. CFH 77666 TaxID=2817942 RepID=UPI001AA0642B|nr:heme-degrading domain-containing protein [Meiothermus sp. CFH 77666]MBO1435622.1 heme-degrading domain-containing protein [Meiothermus sp. CFH 77666]